MSGGAGWELDEWDVSMRAARLADGTRRSYRRAMLRFPGPLTRAGVRGWMAAELARGAAAKSVSNELCAVKAYCKWARDEELLDEVTAAGVLGVKPPKLDVKVVEPLTEDELRRLLAVCGSDFGGRRDEALLRVMADTGARASEVVGLELGDLSLKGEVPVVVIRRGKGGRGRIAAISPQTAKALYRYLRMRKAHSKADTSAALWLGVRGKLFGYSALWLALRARADKAGIEGWHPHKMRHTFADRWLSKGGSESGLRAVAGWSPGSQMLSRYTAGRASARAVEESQRLDLGL